MFDAAIRRAGMLRVDTLQDLFVAAETLARFRDAAPAATSSTDADQRRRRRRDGGRRRGRCRRARWRALAPPTAARGSMPCCPPTGRTATRWTSSATRRSQRYVADAAGAAGRPRQPARCCSCTRPPPSCPAPTSRARCVPLAQQAAARACWAAGSATPAVAEARADLPATPASPATTRPKRRCAPSRCCATYRRNQAQLLQAPPARAARPAPDLRRGARARRRGAGRRPRHARPSPRPRRCWRPTACRWWPRAWSAPTPTRRWPRREAIGYPVALKILSPDITHKSDVGGVALNLRRRGRAARSAAPGHAGARAARCGPTRALQRLHRAGHGAAAARAGADRRRQRRPAVRPGDPVRPGRHRGRGAGRPRAGAAAAERAAGARADRAHPRGAAAAPATATRPPADLDAVADVLIAVSQLLADVPEHRRARHQPAAGRRTRA